MNPASLVTGFSDSYYDKDYVLACSVIYVG